MTDDLLVRLGAPVQSRWYGMIRCPAHDDRSASLSWRLAGSVGARQDEGRALLHCFAGCTFVEILAAAG